MNVIHIYSGCDGYEIVKLLANKISKKNQLALIEKDGQELMTGGHLLNNTPEIRKVLDEIPGDKQYDFVMMFRRKPFVMAFWEE